MNIKIKEEGKEEGKEEIMKSAVDCRKINPDMSYVIGRVMHSIGSYVSSDELYFAVSQAMRGQDIVMEDTILSNRGNLKKIAFRVRLVKIVGCQEVALRFEQWLGGTMWNGLYNFAFAL